METTNYKKGTDLADVLIEENLYNNEEVEMAEQRQYLKPALINTSTEIIVKKLALNNPEILTLINIFQLSDINGIEIRV